MNSMNEEVIKLLEDFGLNKAEAKVYFALISGSGNAKELSKKSGVPYTKIHTILLSLEKKGIIKSSNDRPKIYYIKEGGLEEYKIKLHREIDDKYEKIRNILKEKERPSIWIIRNYEEILNKAHEMLLSSKNEVKIAIPEYFIFYEKITPILIMMKNRGIKVNILISDKISPKLLMDFATVKVGDIMFGGGIIVDNSEVLILVNAYNGIVALWTDNIGLVKMASAYFDFLWSRF
ncbi:MAG: helix-turn-helix domain-containing protein [Candidatus Methanomethylicaceae archaeon]|nr:helix-turn-helix domain-containing protein [Candidatus Verstraetearchaeota archaeon]